MMKPFFLTSTRPRHRYKTESHFINYFKLRTHNVFGRIEGRQMSVVKKMLMLKKIFQWYYKIPTKTLLAKVISGTFRKRQFRFRQLLTFFHNIEHNVLVILVRSKYAKNLIEALALVQSGFVYINGSQVTLTLRILNCGDVLELIPLLHHVVITKRSAFAFTRELQKYRLNYLVNLVYVFFLQSTFSFPLRNYKKFYNYFQNKI